MEALCNVFGYRSCGDDGNGVVGSAYIDKASECSDAGGSSSCTVDVSCQSLDDEVDASVMANDFKHSACQYGDNNQFRHAHHSLVQCGKPAKHVVDSQ